MNKKQIIKAIIHAYRNGAYMIVVYPLTNSASEARRNIRRFGPINHTAVKNDESLFVYSNDIEQIRVSQFVTRVVPNVKKDMRIIQPDTLTTERKKEIEKLLVSAYNNGSQFMIYFPPVTNQRDAVNLLRFFGKPKRIRTNDGDEHYVVDRVLNQFKATVPIQEY